MPGLSLGYFDPLIQLNGPNILTEVGRNCAHNGSGSPLARSCKAFNHIMGAVAKVTFQEALAAHQTDKSPLFECMRGFYNEKKEVCGSADLEGAHYKEIWDKVMQKATNLGVKTPLQMLQLSSIDQIALEFAEKQQKAEDDAIRKLWAMLFTAIESAAKYSDGEISKEMEPAQIREWLKKNQTFISGITILKYWSNDLERIPKEIGLFTGLKEIYLDDNKIVEIPEEIGQLKQLSVLSLRRNRTKKLPDALCQLLELKVLQLSNNALRDLPGKIALLPNLSSLDISDNLIAKLPKEFLERRLDKFDICHNPLKICRENGKIWNLYQRASWFPFSTTSYYMFYEAATNSNAYFQMMFRESLRNLKDEAERNRIYFWFWKESGCPETEDRQWGEKNVFKNPVTLQRAIVKIVGEKLENSSQEFKNRVYEAVYFLSNSPHTDDLQWGEHHLFDDPVVLICAYDWVNSHSRRAARS